MTPPLNDKKERVIHTRVSDTLDDEIKKRATDLGLSVSNLVRNILQHTFGLVEDVLHDSAAIARTARSAKAAFGGEQSQRDPSPAAEPAPEVIGWQEAVLNRNAVCERCNAILAKGARAAIGILAEPGPPPIRCSACLQEVGDDASAHE